MLLVSPHPPPDQGGIATWTRIVCGELAGKGEIEFSHVDTVVRHRSATNVAMHRRLTGGSAQAVRDTYRIYRCLKRDRPDLIHLCTSGGLATVKDILILRMANLLRVPAVIHYHMGRLPSIATSNNLEWKLTRHAMSLASAVITLDVRSEAHVRAALPNQCVVTLPNMVELDVVDRLCGQPELIAPIAEGCLRVVYAGHVIPTKGIRELVAACCRLKNDNMVLDVVGPANASFCEELQSIAQAEGPADWLRFQGSVSHDQAIRHIRSADLFVLPSYSEGAPNVILEAMATGRAILSTTVGSVPEMIDIGGPHPCGVCVPPRDVELLTAAMAQLLSDQERREEYGRRGRQMVEKHYASPVGCAQLAALWTSVARRDRNNGKDSGDV